MVKDDFFTIKDDYFTRLTDDYFTNLQQECLQHLCEIDSEYSDRRDARDKAYREYKEVISGLPRRDAEIVENFREETCLLGDREQDWAYIQGYKDCVKFLRLIELVG